jgi:hypothetical protein
MNRLVNNKEAFTLSKSSRSVGFKVIMFSSIAVFSQLKRTGEEMKVNIRIIFFSKFPCKMLVPSPTTGEV